MEYQVAGGGLPLLPQALGFYYPYPGACSPRADISDWMRVIMVRKSASPRRPQTGYLSARAMLLFSEYSFIVFLLWAVAVEQTKPTRPSVSQRHGAAEISLTSVAHAALPSHSSLGQNSKEVSTQWQCQPAEPLGQFHGVTQVDLCPDPGVPIQIGALRLHVCQRDFFQIAEAINTAVARLPAAETATRLSKTDPDHEPRE